MARALFFGNCLTSKTLAGDKALAMYFSASSCHSTMSIFSPPNSLITAVTLVPLWPTILPMGSIPSTVEVTAIFDLDPASLATDLITTEPEETSGTSNSKSLEIILG